MLEQIRTPETIPTLFTATPGTSVSFQTQFRLREIEGFKGGKKGVHEMTKSELYPSLLNSSLNK